MSTAFERVARSLGAPKAVGLAVATPLAIVAAFATQAVLPSSQVAFLLVVVLGVSVPTTLESYGLLPDDPGRVVAVVVAACLVHWVLFLALVIGLLALAGELVAAAVAFVVTVLAGAVVGRSLE